MKDGPPLLIEYCCSNHSIFSALTGPISIYASQSLVLHDFMLPCPSHGVLRIFFFFFAHFLCIPYVIAGRVARGALVASRGGAWWPDGDRGPPTTFDLQ